MGSGAIRRMAEEHNHDVEDQTSPAIQEALRRMEERHNYADPPEMTPEEEAAFRAMERPGALTMEKP